MLSLQVVSEQRMQMAEHERRVEDAVASAKRMEERLMKEEKQRKADEEKKLVAALPTEEKEVGATFRVPVEVQEQDILLSWSVECREEVSVIRASGGVSEFQWVSIGVSWCQWVSVSVSECQLVSVVVSVCQHCLTQPNSILSQRPCSFWLNYIPAGGEECDSVILSCR